MTDVPRLPNIGWVLQKRNVSLDRWLEEHQVITPGDLRKVCDRLGDQYDFPEEWVRMASVAVLDRMMLLPVSIGFSSPPSVPVIPLVEEVSAPEPEVSLPASGKKSNRTSVRKSGKKVVDDEEGLEGDTSGEPPSPIPFEPIP